MTPPFAPGAELGLGLYRDVVAPVVAVPHAAGLLGPGSEVLGYDTPRSTDHDWAPGVTVLVAAEDVEAVRLAVDAVLPATYRGWPTRAGRDGLPPRHRVVVAAVGPWLRETLGVDPGEGLGTPDWLAVPQQLLLHVVAGPVFHDEPGRLSTVRRRLAWYPDDVWWWLMACHWRRLAQEEPFVQRTAEVGDATGSAVVAARLVRDVMRLALLQARRYAPYAKWLGSAFAASDHQDGLDVVCRAAVLADDVADREAALASAYESLARRHARLPGASDLDPTVRGFYERPALVLDADRFTRDCLRQVTDPALLALPLVGGVDQLVDSTDLFTDPTLVPQVRRFYEGLVRARTA